MHDRTLSQVACLIAEHLLFFYEDPLAMAREINDETGWVVGDEGDGETVCLSDEELLAAYRLALVMSPQ